MLLIMFWVFYCLEKKYVISIGQSNDLYDLTGQIYNWRVMLDRYWCISVEC